MVLSPELSVYHSLGLFPVYCFLLCRSNTMRTLNSERLVGSFSHTADHTVGVKSDSSCRAVYEEEFTCISPIQQEPEES